MQPVTADLHAALDADGHALIPSLLSPARCRELIALWEDETAFRKRINMGQYRYGRGEYRYFARPLPDAIQELRESFYALLAPIASAWSQRLREGIEFPPTLPGFLARCAAAGQDRPTPLLLRYGPGDYNRLHQDLYGGVVFPLQLVIQLSAPGTDFDGGEFVLVEQQARMQSRPRVVALRQGDGLVFPVHHRPVAGLRGDVRVNMRHGVSTIHRGDRVALGVIFHDAD